jgi:undecaprenyl-diphosphatase
MAFFLFSALLYLIVRKDARRLLKTPGPYLAFVVSMLVFSPVIFWNASHGWVTVRHTAGQAHVHEGLIISLRTFGEFFGSQAGVVTPLLFVMIFLALRKTWHSREGSFLFWFSVPVIMFFLVKSIQGKVQANWALTGYIALMIAFSAAYIRKWGDLGRSGRLATVASVCLALLVTLFAYFPSLLRLPDRLDPSMRLVGWRELGKEASSRYKELSGKGPAFVFSDSYQVASELAFYMDGKPVTYCADTGRRMNQYDLWPGFETLKGGNALFVRTKEKGLPEEVDSAFSNCEQEVITVTTKKRKTMKFTVFTCYDFKGFKSRPPESF